MVSDHEIFRLRLDRTKQFCRSDNRFNVAFIGQIYILLEKKIWFLEILEHRMLLRWQHITISQFL